MSFSVTRNAVIGIGVSPCAAALAADMTASGRVLGFDVRCYDLAKGAGIELEADASSGKLSLLVELGLGDYLIEALNGTGVVTSRLTGAISRKVPQIWVFLRDAIPLGAGPDTWDLAGRQLAWLASAAEPTPAAIVCPDGGVVDTLAQSFRLWALPAVSIVHAREDALLQLILGAVSRLLQPA